MISTLLGACWMPTQMGPCNLTRCAPYSGECGPVCSEQLCVLAWPFIQQSIICTIVCYCVLSPVAPVLQLVGHATTGLLHGPVHATYVLKL